MPKATFNKHFQAAMPSTQATGKNHLQRITQTYLPMLMSDDWQQQKGPNA
jgi:hypothetical protein